MLETSQERVKLLRAGIPAKTMEQLYLKSNNFKIISTPILFVAVNMRPENKGNEFSCEIPAVYVSA